MDLTRSSGVPITEAAPSANAVWSTHWSFARPTPPATAAAPDQRVSPQCAGGGGGGPGPRAEHPPPAGHVVELDDPLRHIEGMVVGRGDPARAQANAVGALARRGQEHL